MWRNKSSWDFFCFFVIEFNFKLYIIYQNSEKKFKPHKSTDFFILLFKMFFFQAKQQGQTDMAREYLKQALSINKLIGTHSFVIKMLKFILFLFIIVCSF